jgi:ribonuclease BN (tRNA processing enzyme)
VPVDGGVVWQEPGFTVRAVELDHGTPVLAYALEPAARFRVCPDRLRAHGLSTGPWLQDLKQAWLAGRREALISLPDGSRRSVAQLRKEILLVGAADKLVYATDLADTVENRRKLVHLARGAHSLFCEAAFMVEHRRQAQRTNHLTTAACAEIANLAGVERLLPFHFSRRYIRRTAAIYQELGGLCAQTVVPRGI